MAKDNKNFFKTKNSWSEIKDQLLGCYLTPYFQKVLMTGQPIFYVDCFAGKGKFDDGKDGSPRIALQVRDGCLSRTTLGNGRGQIDTCFIDLNYAQELSVNIADFDNANGRPNVISGKYEDKIEGLLSGKRGVNVFLYIDPYGIRALDSGLFDKFETYGFRTLEMLINFNSFGFFRDTCRVMKVDYQNDEALQDLDDLVEYEPTKVSATKQSEDLLTRIAGGDYWKAIVTNYNEGRINGFQAEKRLSAEYKQRLRQRYGYVLDMPIRLKPGQRPKYRMIHVCDHEDGCFLMAQNMQKRKDELFINVQQEGQLSLIDVVPTMTSTAENELVTTDEIKAKLKEHLARFSGDVRITTLLATFVNDYGLLCQFRMIYDILEEMKSCGMIDIERTPAVTITGKQSAFWEETKGKQIVIRRIKP
ncbi:MAG: three-Cys-motif partner protein TcmP [Firmicutes bacterium]|nr:three-Cys-motif partner protein TcmP [Bacillota bacterium]MCL5058943.1 three-Cys-motif partner protein TcmP [Actinomycetota bacterium]